MLKTRLRKFILIVALATTILGLGGCRKEDKTPPPTPAVQQKAPGQQSSPSTGQSKSPLPTPNTATSPVKK
jgi:hypothetical protein